MRQSMICAFVKVDHVVGMGIHKYSVLPQLREFSAVSLYKGVEIGLGSPVCIVDDAGAICAFVQCRCDEAWLVLDLFGEARPRIDKRLLLLWGRIKDIDQGHQIVLLRNKHLY